MKENEYLIDFSVYIQESNKTQTLSDSREASVRLEMLRKIMNLTKEYYEHTNAYDYEKFRKEISARGMRFTPVDHRTTKTKWTKLFAASIPKEDRKKVYFEQYRWHLFSFDLLEALKENAARTAFNACSKDTAYLFFQHTDQAYLVENAHLLMAADFDYIFLPHPDIYLFDSNGKWTYIHTHESMCGPYFYQPK